MSFFGSEKIQLRNRCLDACTYLVESIQAKDMGGVLNTPILFRNMSNNKKVEVGDRGHCTNSIIRHRTQEKKRNFMIAKNENDIIFYGQF